jgi:hypothetical protein
MVMFAFSCQLQNQCSWLLLSSHYFRSGTSETHSRRPILSWLRDQALAALLIVLLFAGCGGGSSGDDGPPAMVSLTSTSNPLVASYSVTTFRKARVQVEFGPDIS